MRAYLVVVLLGLVRLGNGLGRHGHGGVDRLDLDNLWTFESMVRLMSGTAFDQRCHRFYDT